MKCIICKVNDTEGFNEYCGKCFSTAIEELDRKYGKKEGPVFIREDVDQAPVSEPFAENTHR